MAHAINTVAPGFNLIARIGGLIESTKLAWAQNAEYKRTFAELDGLDNRDLADIGVRRGDISDIARMHVYGH
jgi:uncharacterized protein YjiS (DUF1127 family)